MLQSNRRGRQAVAAAVESLETRQFFSAVGVSGTEVLVQVGNTEALRTITHWVSKHPHAALTRTLSLKHSKQLFATNKTSTVQLRLQKGMSVGSALKALSKVPGVRWASPNYVYQSTKGELTPNDPRLANQLAHLDRIKAPQAWDTTTGTGITVAVLDEGVDLEHEDLAANIWTNAGEIAGNGIDDDNNGYIDDINGWDFGSNDNNPRPVLDQTYNFINSHGTLVAGILGAAINNNLGIAGIAGGVKIMPVRFQGYGVTVTSAGIAQSLAYAANNGAKIINISFSIDPYMNDLAFTAATDLAYSKGAIWINSAGNQNVANPPRLTIEKALFVANTRNTDVRYTDSNWGDGIDLAAPGEEVRGTIPQNGYQVATGTSFSAAVTSGVAALIWAAHPTWTRDQVVAQLVGSVDNIDALNPTFIGQLGTGRVNALTGVGQQIGAPTVRGLKGLADNATITAIPSKLTLNLYNVLDGTTVTNGNFELRYAGEDGVFNENDTTIPVALTGNYFYGTNQLNFTLPANMANGLYRFTAKSDIKDPFGQSLDGDKNGTGGDDYVTTFTLNVPAPTGPAAPSNLAVIRPSYSDSEAEITWVDNATNETGFIIERSSTSDFAVINKTMTAGANSARYNDWGLTQGNTYYYRVKATNAQGNSPASNVVALEVPLPPPGIPNAPATFTASTPSYSDTEVVLAWADSSNNETGFVIERSSSSSFATVDKTFTTGPSAGYYNDWGLTPGQVYYYRVKAINGADSSVWTNAAPYQTPGGTPTLPAAPSGLATAAVSGSTTSATITWTDNAANETGFELVRSTTSDFSANVVTVSLAANATGYVSTDLAVGTMYYYRIRAIGTAGNSAYSASATFTTVAAPTAPAAPTNASVDGTANSAIFRWDDNSSDEIGFEIVRSTSADFTQNMVTVTLTATKHTFSDLAAGTTYYFRVRALGTSANSVYSNTATLTTATIPAAPSNFTLTPLPNAGSARLDWTDNSDNETRFYIIRSTSADFTTDLVATPIQANTTTHTVSGLTPSTTYYFHVRSEGVAGNSAFSASASYTPAAAPTVPAAPTGLTASAIVGTVRDANITWVDNANNETGYSLERSTTSNFTAGTTTTVALGANVTTYASTGLAASTTYYYRVRANNAVGNSAYSNTGTFTTPAPVTIPTAPSNLAVAASATSDTAVNITWRDNANNETKFELQRSTNNGFTANVVTLDIAANAVSYTDAGLTTGTRYYYRLRAVNSAGNSAYASSVNITPAVRTPSAPTSFTGTATSTTAILLSWSDTSYNETRFEIQRSTNILFIGTTTINADPNTTSISNTGLSRNTTYYYRIRAINSAGNSSYTSSISVRTNS